MAKLTEMTKQLEKISNLVAFKVVHNVFSLAFA